MAGDLNEPGDYGLRTSFQETEMIFNKKNKCDCPGKVKVIDRLKENLTVLCKLFDHVTPPKRFVWGKDVCTTQYGFGGALGSGFGSS